MLMQSEFLETTDHSKNLSPSSLADLASSFTVTSNLNNCYVLLNLSKLELLPLAFPHCVSKLPKMILLPTSCVFVFAYLGGQFF